MERQSDMKSVSSIEFDIDYIKRNLQASQAEIEKREGQLGEAKAVHEANKRALDEAIDELAEALRREGLGDAEAP